MPYRYELELATLPLILTVALYIQISLFNVDFRNVPCCTSSDNIGLLICSTASTDLHKLNACWRLLVNSGEYTMKNVTRDENYM